MSGTTTEMTEPVSALEPSASLTPEGAVVLLVDDQIIIREAVRRMLAPHEGIVLHYCQKAEDALAMAVEVKPTVILQDLVMPGIDGLDLVRGYRQQGATKLTPLIVLSSKEEGITKAEAFARGANDYIVKLPDPIEFVARIRYHSRGYRSLLERNAAYEALNASQQALTAEVAKAAEYVRSLLPAPCTDPVAIDWRFVPSTSLGGDCFDYFWIDNDHLAIYLLDVCGHGVGPALLGVSAMNSVRSRGVGGADLRDPTSVLRDLNASYPMAKHRNMYFTIWYGVYRQSTRTLCFSGGGHPPPLLIGDAVPGSVGLRQLSCDGLPVGISPDEEFPAVTIGVAPGSSLLIYSDGAIEVFQSTGRLWGVDGLAEFVRRHVEDKSISLDGIYSHVKAMNGNDVLDDDFSIVLAQFP
jgi:sigma-B regulation protein RsbU (phosphoserine phosphatase)